jgi:GNAT superfamily N-acetyltransferase
MPSVNSLIQAFLYVKNQDGWRIAIEQTIQWLISPFFEYSRGFYLRKPLNAFIDIPATRVDVTIRPATLDDLDLFQTIVPPLRVKRFARKIQAGEVCFIAVREQGEKSNIVGYLWTGFADSSTVQDTFIKLGPKEAYFWAGYVVPEYRRHKLLSALGSSLRAWLQDQGYDAVVTFVEWWNEASLAVCLKQGYHIVAQVSYLKLLKWKRCRWYEPDKT